MRPLDGRTAIVTGAGQGVGRGIALALAAAGANVVVAARRALTGEPVAAEIRGRGGVAECIVTDCTVRTDVEACVDATVARFGGLEIMVHNAFAGGRAHRLEDLDLALWDENSRTGAWASFYAARVAYPHLAAAGDRGRLVFVTSPAAVEASAGIPAYGPVKAAQRALAKSLAREWGPLGVTVNCIAPVAETPALAGAFAERPELEERMRLRTALRRIGDAERDIGGVVVFLAAEAGGYVTGQTVVCDGGSFLGL